MMENTCIPAEQIDKRSKYSINTVIILLLPFLMKTGSMETEPYIAWYAKILLTNTKTCIGTV